MFVAAAFFALFAIPVGMALGYLLARVVYGPMPATHGLETHLRQRIKSSVMTWRFVVRLALAIGLPAAIASALAMLMQLGWLPKESLILSTPLPLFFLILSFATYECVRRDRFRALQTCGRLSVCPRCHHDLTDLTCDQCPECGEFVGYLPPDEPPAA